MNHSELVEYVRREFFPLWDLGRRWEIEIGGVYVEDANSPGYCDLNEKKIYVWNFDDETETMMLLIHEITHAVVNGCHNKRFLARYEVAARKAEGLGLHQLAQRMDAEIDDIRSGTAEQPKAADIYIEIQTIITEAPDITFDKLVDYIRRLYGFSREEFLKRYKLCRRHFDDTYRPPKRKG